MTAKMTIMQGLPASGKSSKAKELLLHGNTVRINKDLLRTMLHCDKFNGKIEELTGQASQGLSRYFLSKGVNVIIDDTNLNPKTVQRWVDLAKEMEAKIVYEKCFNVSVQECVERDAAREKKVGAHVIKKMALQYLDYMKGEDVVICDLDGTLCDIDHRLHFVKGDKKDWGAFFGGIPLDSVRRDVVDQVWGRGVKIIFVSARPEACRGATEDWLSNNFLDQHEVLIMRDEGDHRDDTMVKSDIYDKYLKNLNIVQIFDDRPKVIRMWRAKGLPVHDCGSGVEF